MLKEIPCVDLSDSNAAQVIGEAFRDIGFAFISAPETSQKLAGHYAEFEKVFGLPESVKQKYEHADIGHQRGRTPYNTEQAVACRNTGPGGGPQPNAYECWFIGPETVSRRELIKQYPVLYHPNVWPSEVPTFRNAMLELYADFYALGRRMMATVETFLDYRTGLFDWMMEDSPTVMRALHYPRVTPEQVGSVVWGCKHTDINLVTILPASTRGGLWIRRRDGEWIPGNAPEGYAIGQVGDMLSHITGGYFLSAEHEVRAPNYATETGRLSAAMFMHPRSDVWITPDLRWADPCAYQPITAGRWLHKRLVEIGVLKENEAL